jgi:hypothetical protein
MSRPGGWPILGLAGLAVFSLAFSFAAERGLWPELPPGALHDSDLWAGLAGGAVLVVLLLRPERNQRGGRETGGKERQPEATDAAQEIAPSPALHVSGSETEATVGADIPARAKRYSG